MIFASIASAIFNGVLVALLLVNSAAVAWLLLRGGLPLRLRRSRLGDLSETEVADLIGRGHEVSTILDQMEGKVVEGRQRMGELQTRYLRLVRSESQARQAHIASVQRLAMSMIELIDHIDVSVRDSGGAASPNADDGKTRIAPGDSYDRRVLLQIRNMLLDALARQRIRDVSADVGQRFDSSQHRAVDRRVGPQEANTILEVIQRGFWFGEDGSEVLRPATVIVCSGPEEKRRDEESVVVTAQRANAASIEAVARKSNRGEHDS